MTHGPRLRAQIITLLAWHSVYEAKYTFFNSDIHPLNKLDFILNPSYWIGNANIKLVTQANYCIAQCHGEQGGIQPGLLLVISICFCTFISSLWCLTSASAWHPRASWHPSSYNKVMDNSLLWHGNWKTVESVMFHARQWLYWWIDDPTASSRVTLQWGWLFLPRLSVLSTECPQFRLMLVMSLGATLIMPPSHPDKS